MLGSSGSGKSTVINRVFKEDRCDEIVINDKKYHCTFLELNSSSDRSQREAQFLSIGSMNLIVFVLRMRCFFSEEIEAFKRLVGLVRDASSISAFGYYWL